MSYSNELALRFDDRRWTNTRGIEIELWGVPLLSILRIDITDICATCTCNLIFALLGFALIRKLDVFKFHNMWKRHELWKNFGREAIRKMYIFVYAFELGLWKKRSK